MLTSRSAPPAGRPDDAEGADGEHDRPLALFPFFRRAAAVTALVAAVGILLFFLWKAVEVLLLVFAGILLAVLLHGLARRLSEYAPLSYGWSLALTCASLAGLLALAIWLVAPQVSAQIGELREVLPASLDRLEEQLRAFGWGEYAVDRMPAPREVMSGGDGFWSRLTGILSTAVGMVANTLIILVLGVYLAANPGLYERGMVMLVPRDKEEHARATLQAVGHALWSWLVGQLISMTLIGVLVWLGLMIIGIPLALGLGFIAGLFEFVPLIGPWAGAVPGLLVALLQSPTKLLYAGLLYLAVQQLESNLITPLVMKEAVSLPPALTISSTLIGGALFGIPGILLATPLMVTAMVVVRKVYVEGVLGKDPDHPEPAPRADAPQP